MDTNFPLNGCRTTRIYCLPGCPAGRRTKPENRVYFKSRNEALAEGYRACKICKPDGPAVAPNVLFLTHHQTPLGVYLLASSHKGVVCVKSEKQAPLFLERWERQKVEFRDTGGHNRELESQIDSYFAGKLRQFNVPLDLKGTPFQCQVWNLLCGIPYGETRSYRQIGESLGRPQAARAVGRAVGTNPVAIVVPCHRVIGSHGDLTGYGGGLHRKEALLKLETAHISPLAL